MGGTLEKTASRPLVVVISSQSIFIWSSLRKEKEKKRSSRSTCMLAKYIHVKI